MSDPNFIDLQFVLGSGLSSRLIAWYGQGFGGWSHVDAVLPDGTLLGARDDKVGGQPAGVRIRPPFYEKWKRRTGVRIATSAQLAKIGNDWLLTQIGQAYDDAAIRGFITARPDHDAGRWICSALQRGRLAVMGVAGACSQVPVSQTTPDSLFQVVTLGLSGRVIVDTVA